MGLGPGVTRFGFFLKEAAIRCQNMLVLALCFNDLCGFVQKALGFGICGPPGMMHELTQIGKRRLRLILPAQPELSHRQEGKVGRSANGRERTSLARSTGRLTPLASPRSARRGSI